VCVSRALAGLRLFKPSFLMGISFFHLYLLDLCPLFHECKWEIKQGLGVMLKIIFMFHNKRSVSIVKTIWLMLFREIISVYCRSVQNAHVQCVWAQCGIVLFCTLGRAVPLQAQSGPEGSRKLRFPDYMTTAQDGGKVVSPTHRLPLPTRNPLGTHFC